MALRVAEQRRRREQSEAALRQEEVRHKQVLQQAVDPSSSACDHPLAQRLAAIGERVKRRASERDDGASVTQAVPYDLSSGRLPGAGDCPPAAGTPALREAFVPPSAGALLQVFPEIGAAGTAQRRAGSAY